MYSPLLSHACSVPYSRVSFRGFLTSLELSDPGQGVFKIDEDIEKLVLASKRTGTTTQHGGNQSSRSLGHGSRAGGSFLTPAPEAF